MRMVMSEAAVTMTSLDGNCRQGCLSMCNFRCTLTDAYEEGQRRNKEQRTNSHATRSPTWPLSAVSFPFPIRPPSYCTTSTTLACPSLPPRTTRLPSGERANESIARGAVERNEGAGDSCVVGLRAARDDDEVMGLRSGEGRRATVDWSERDGHETTNSLCGPATGQGFGRRAGKQYTHGREHVEGDAVPPLDDVYVYGSVGVALGDAQAGMCALGVAVDGEPGVLGCDGRVGLGDVAEDVRERGLEGDVGQRERETGRWRVHGWGLAGVRVSVWGQASLCVRRSCS